MSDYTTTPNYGLYKPTVDADDGQWGAHLNANADKLDTTLHGISAGSPFLPAAGGVLGGPLVLPSSGTAAAPVLRFEAAFPNSGIYGTGHFLHISLLGTLVWTVSTNMLTANFGVSFPGLAASTSYTNDAAAAAGGVLVGQLYRSGSAVMIRVT